MTKRIRRNNADPAIPRFLELPAAVWSHALTFLELEAIMSVAGVCVALRKVAQSPASWHRVEVAGITRRRLAAVLAACPDVLRVARRCAASVNAYYDESPDALGFASFNEFLARACTADAAALEAERKEWYMDTNFVWRRRPPADAPERLLRKEARPNPIKTANGFMRELDLRGGLGHRDVTHLAHAFPNLVSLKIGGHHGAEDAWTPRTFSLLFARLKRLRSLALDGGLALHRPGPETLVRVPLALETLVVRSHVRSIEGQAAREGDVCKQVVRKANFAFCFSVGSRLRTLRLDPNDEYGVDWSLEARAVPSLTALEIGGNKLAGSAHLRDILALPRLTRLTLDRFWLRDEIDWINLPNQVALQKLDIWHSNISANFIRAIGRACDNLRDIRVHTNQSEVEQDCAYNECLAELAESAAMRRGMLQYIQLPISAAKTASVSTNVTRLGEKQCRAVAWNVSGRALLIPAKLAPSNAVLHIRAPAVTGDAFRDDVVVNSAGLARVLSFGTCLVGFGACALPAYDPPRLAPACSLPNDAFTRATHTCFCKSSVRTIF